MSAYVAILAQRVLLKC